MNKVAVGIISKIRDNKQEEYLLIQSKKDFGEFTGSYYPPGGHLEGNENASEALIREFKEELGLNVIPTHEIAITPGDVNDQLTHWWLCETKSGNIKIKEDEIADAAYFTAEEMEQIKIWPATRNFFNTHIFKNKTLSL